jgi:hypothetical protein
MKYICLIFAFLVFFIGCASTPFEGWTKADTMRQAAYTGLHIVDWAQTIQIARNPDKFEECGLLRIVSGNHPTDTQVHQFFGGTLILQTVIPSMLKPKYRQAWQTMWIGIEGSNDIRNFSLGLHGEF